MVLGQPGSHRSTAVRSHSCVTIVTATTVPLLPQKTRLAKSHQRTKSSRENEGALKSPAPLADSTPTDFLPSSVSSSPRRRADTLPEFWSMLLKALSAANRSICTTSVGGAPHLLPLLAAAAAAATARLPLSWNGGMPARPLEGGGIGMGGTGTGLACSALSGDATKLTRPRRTRVASVSPSSSSSSSTPNCVQERKWWW